MADWHLAELDDELRSAGWEIEEVLPGDGYRTSAVWVIGRGDARRELSFYGQTETGIALPLDEAYACHLAGTDDEGLYFSRKSSPHWRPDLRRFVAMLGE